jgi:hypothetical protein
VYCSPEFQKILEPVLLVPPLRLIVELLNIPTIEEDKKAACAAVKPGGLADSVADLVTPEVGVIPGGPMNTASKVAEIAEDPSAAIANAVDEKKEEMKEAVEKEEPVTGSVKNKVAAIEKKIAATKKAAKGGARNGKKKRNRKTRRKTRNRNRK